MKTILITGANGQLGQELQFCLQNRADVTLLCTDVTELDITSQDAIDSYFENHTVDVLINCAAFTLVDKAENDEQLAHRINADAVRLLATACQVHGVRMVHISTDYVFDGYQNTPYVETDEPHPVTAYGRTKFEGEMAVTGILPNDAVIIRTAWLYSPHGKNFVKTMLSLGEARHAIKVVVDQVGSPTYALDLAQAIVDIVDHHEWHPGVYHFSNEGAISWYDFTMSIFRIAGIKGCKVEPCRSEDFPTAAHRPAYSVLDKSKIKQTYGFTIPHWEASLQHCINLIINQ